MKLGTFGSSLLQTTITFRGWFESLNWQDLINYLVIVKVQT